MTSPRLQRLMAKIGLPLVAVLAGIGLSAAVAATYLTITGESEVGEFSPVGVPMEDADAAGTTPTTEGPLATVDTTVPVAAPPPTVAPAAPGPAPTTTAVRPRSSPTTAAVRSAPAPTPTTTTTAKCDNSGKGNCRSRGGGGGGDDDGTDD